MASNGTLQNEWRGRISRYAPLIFWIAVILFLSTMQGSMTNTSRFIRPLLRFFFPGMPEESLITFHVYIRKTAHVIEYAGLGFWASRAFWGSYREFVTRYWYLFAWALVLMISSIDEFNQSFNAARSGSFNDVILDGLSGLVMILMLCGYQAYMRRRANFSNESMPGEDLKQ